MPKESELECVGDAGSAVAGSGRDGREVELSEHYKGSFFWALVLKREENTKNL